MSNSFDETISKIQQRCDKLKIDLPKDWPGFTFKNMCDYLLLDPGVVFMDALTRSYTRSTLDEFNLAGLIGTMQQVYLRITICIPADDLVDHVNKTRRGCKSC